MLARGALCRLAAEAPKQAVHDLPKLASLVQTARAGYALPLRTLAHALQLQTRSYATEPTATVKKAVKTKAAAGKSVKKTTTAKKSAAKKPVKKAAPKKAKKKAAPKKKAVKKPKKVLTPEEKERAVISKLRKLALKEPVARRQITAFNVYLQDNVTKSGGTTLGLGELSKGWKDISAAEHEKYNHLAAERNEARRAEYKAWVESHTPEVIRIANNARAALKRKLGATRKNNKSPSHTQRIDDERAVKRPVAPWARFFGERATSTDFKSIALKEKTSLIAGEWRALSANEKQRYEDQFAADKQRYERELAAQTKEFAT